MANYMGKLDDGALCTSANFEFARTFSALIPQNLIDLCSRKTNFVDDVMKRKGYAEEFMNDIVHQNEIEPIKLSASRHEPEPDWQHLEAVITKKYGPAFVDHNLNVAKLEWHWFSNDFKNVPQYIVRNVAWMQAGRMQPGAGSVTFLNNSAYYVFAYSAKREYLEKALAWVDQAIRMRSSPNVDALDTKANILYKLGRKGEGIALEEKVVKKEPANKDLIKTLDKMKKGLPTWPNE
jgi:tetratricopeptide (TPR) repeat protein